jgi:hypothetical protein
MKAKFIEDVLFEKFTEESDPIHDMHIGHTKYRTFRPFKQRDVRVLQYLKGSFNLFGKPIENWVYVRLPFSPELRKQYRKEEEIHRHVEYYFVAGYDTEIFKKFIDEWPYIKDYLKYRKEEENRMIERLKKQKEEEKQRKRREEDERYEYLN